MEEMAITTLGKKQILFGCESVYQLFNAIILRMTVCAENDCDIILSNITTWQKEMLQRLEEAKVFRKIFCPDTHSLEYDFWPLATEEKKKVYRNPVLFFHNDPPVEPVYDELFFSIDHLFWKMIYYYHIVSNKEPIINMYDEGVRAYTMELFNTENKFYSKEAYSQSFPSAIKRYYLWQPALYAVPKYTYELLPIHLPEEDNSVKETLLQVFGYEKLPEEECIYLEDFFFADHYITNDFSLFRQVAEIVGRDNIIVKRHPRDQYDRFTANGYKTVANSVVPWEIQLLANDMNDKFLVSVSSTSILTPYMIFNSPIHVISLENMFFGDNPTHGDKAYNNFISSLKNKVNEKEIHIHAPHNADELLETIRYIRLKQHLGFTEEKGETIHE